MAVNTSKKSTATTETKKEITKWILGVSYDNEKASGKFQDLVLKSTTTKFIDWNLVANVFSDPKTGELVLACKLAKAITELEGGGNLQNFYSLLEMLNGDLVKIEGFIILGDPLQRQFEDGRIIINLPTNGLIDISDLGYLPVKRQ